jgi:excisionase family DNA binding protein
MFYTTKEVATMLGTDRKNLVKNYIHTGLIKAIKVGKRFKISVDEFNAYIKRSEYKPEER